MNNAKWFDRKFDFQNESQDIPVIYQRLKETPPQLRKHVSSLSSEQLRYKPGGKWSVIEHCGHLFILEQLWQTRIIDIIRGQPILTAADLDNRATTEGRFNTMNIDNVLNDFENARKITLRQLDLLSPNDLVKQSMHPRVKQPMRMQDHIYFVAEHDAHHVARIGEIIAAFNGR